MLLHLTKNFIQVPPHFLLNLLPFYSQKNKLHQFVKFISFPLGATLPKIILIVGGTSRKFKPSGLLILKVNGKEILLLNDYFFLDVFLSDWFRLDYQLLFVFVSLICFWSLFLSLIFLFRFFLSFFEELSLLISLNSITCTFFI